MSRLFSKAALSVILAAALALSLSGGVIAAVKATSPLTVAKLVKSGDGFSIVHGSGFSFLLPTEGDLSVYEAKDAYGLRKLYVSSSQGPVIEISAAKLDTLTVGPLDGMSMSFLRESEAKASGAISIKAAGIEGLQFSVQGKATAVSGTAPIRLYTLLTDYNRAILIVAYAQETSLVAAQNLVGKLIIGLQLDDSWIKATV
jgi:hypothetical protein